MKSLALACLVLSVVLLVIGVTAPVITIRGVLLTDGLLDVVVNAMAAKAGPADQARFTGEGREATKRQLNSLIGMFIPADASREIYTQTRSILGSVRSLFANGGWFAAILILLFSIVVPVAKAALMAWALLWGRGEQRARVVRFIELIGKWSMADVFVVAIFIVYLAAKASVGTAQAVAFSSHFGSGFYFFAAYCLVALVGQQITHAWLAREEFTLAADDTTGRSVTTP